MAASLKLKTKLPIILRKLFLDLEPRISRDITTCSACLIKAKQSVKSNDADLPNTGSGAAGVKTVVVPTKIERSPTAILEALASTVRYDANEPMYMGIDDPHLLNSQDRVKKYNMAAKESGRKAAQTMLALYPDYFTQVWQDTLPQAYAHDPYQGYRHKEPSGEALLERIQGKKVKDALEIYEACRRESISLSQDLQEELLELLCVYNCSDPQGNVAFANWVNPDMKLYPDAPKHVWSKNNEAEQVFQSLPEKSATAYNMLLRGRAHHYDKEGALELYSTMTQLDIPVDVYTYNKLINVLAINQESIEDTIDAIKALFNDMKVKGIIPNAGTFSSALTVIKYGTKFQKAKRFALSLLAEMKACGIEPELSTYNILVDTFFYSKAKQAESQELFESILNNMEGKEYEIRSSADVSFFRTATKSMISHFPDSKLALKLHSILKYGNNSKAMGHRQFIWGYYADLFTLIAPLEDSHTVMELYRSICPHIFLPGNGQIKLILENIQLHDAHHYLPEIFADLFWTDMMFNSEIVDLFMKTMSTKKHDPELQQKFSDIATTLLDSWLTSQEFQRVYTNAGLNGAVIGEMISVYLNNDEPDKAMNVYQIFKDNKKTLGSAEPSMASLSQLTEHCITTQDYTMVKELLTVMLSMDGSNIPGLVDKVLTSDPNMSEQDKNFYLGLSQDAQKYSLPAKTEKRKKRSRVKKDGGVSS